MLSSFRSVYTVQICSSQYKQAGNDLPGLILRISFEFSLLRKLHENDSLRCLKYLLKIYGCACISHFLGNLPLIQLTSDCSFHPVFPLSFHFLVCHLRDYFNVSLSRYPSKGRDFLNISFIVHVYLGSFVFCEVPLKPLLLRRSFSLLWSFFRAFL